MIPLSDARTYVLDRVAPLKPEMVRLDDALGLVLAEPVTSAVAIPPFRNTAMDRICRALRRHGDSTG